jgi:uncharacterized protein YndB with AHSA1/START domain
MNKSEKAGDLAAREITVTREFGAPRELVFAAWTDPVHVSKWWGPKGFTTTTTRMEMRPGGVWELVMHGPDGTDYPSKIVFVEIVKPERVVYDHVLAPLFRSTSIFEDLGPRSRLTVTLRFESAKVCEQAVRQHGALKGLQEMVVRLAEHMGKGI